jgi:hypothetical protein
MQENHQASSHAEAPWAVLFRLGGLVVIWFVTLALHLLLGAVFTFAYVVVLYRHRLVWQVAAVVLFLVSAARWL